LQTHCSPFDLFDLAVFDDAWVRKWNDEVTFVAAVSININGLWGSKRAPVAQFLPAEYKVAELPSESFGSLTSVSLVEANAQNQNKAVGGETAPVLMTAENLPVATPVTSASVPVQDTEGKMIAPELYPAPQPYSFKYTGGELPELPKTQPVYKRVNSLAQSNNGNLHDFDRNKDPIIPGKIVFTRSDDE
jgi:hypothetical protein